MKYDELYEKINKDFPEETNFYRKKLKWIELRCILETATDYDKNENMFIWDKNIFVEFINSICTDGWNPDTLKEKMDSNENQFEKLFYNFLYEKEINEEKVSVFWNSNPQKYIEKLYDYRGIVDANISDRLLDFAKSINNDELRYIYELIQNADDCEYSEDGVVPSITMKLKEGEMIVSYPEDGMTYSDILAITTIGQSNKRKKKKKRIIGEKGIGFKTIFSICDEVKIYSGKYKFSLNSKNFQPKWITNECGDHIEHKGTKLVLVLKKLIGDQDNTLIKGKEVYQKILRKYGIDEDGNVIWENAFKNCPILFTNKLKMIEIEYLSDDEESCRRIVIEKEQMEDEWAIQYQMDNASPCRLVCYAKEKKVEMTWEEYYSHYKEVILDEGEYEACKRQTPEVITYPIIAVVPKSCQEIMNGNIYSYLPTFTNLKAPISIQIPFELNQDRSSMWINGLDSDEHSQEDYEEGYSSREDNYTTKWNKRLFEEVFVNKNNVPCLLEELFNELKTKEDIDIIDYLPKYLNADKQLFCRPAEGESNRYDSCIEKMNNYSKDSVFNTFKNMRLLKSIDGKRFCSFSEAIMFDEFVNGIIMKHYDEFYECAKKLLTDISKDNIVQAYRLDENIEALGLQRVEIEDSKKVVEFVNLLLQLDRKQVIEEYCKEDAVLSDYLPQKASNEAKQLKIINVNTEKGCEYWAYEEAGLWIKLENTKRYVSNTIVSLFDPNLNIAINETGLFRKNDFCIPQEEKTGEIWESVWQQIHSQKGNQNEFKCSYALFREMMKLLALYDENQIDWFELVKKIVVEGLEDNNHAISENIKMLWKSKSDSFRQEAAQNDGNT